MVRIRVLNSLSPPPPTRSWICLGGGKASPRTPLPLKSWIRHCTSTYVLNQFLSLVTCCVTCVILHTVQVPELFPWHINSCSSDDTNFVRYERINNKCDQHNDKRKGKGCRWYAIHPILYFVLGQFILFFISSSCSSSYSSNRPGAN